MATISKKTRYSSAERAKKKAGVPASSMLSSSDAKCLVQAMISTPRQPKAELLEVMDLYKSIPQL